MAERRAFQGVLNILSFNRHFYIYGLVGLVLLFLSRFIFPWSDVIFWIVVGAWIYGMLMPLIVSAYVYDFSGYYNLNWLKPWMPSDGKAFNAISVHAGFDETSYSIAELWPNVSLKAYDFYDAQRQTEPAIQRARKVTLGFPDTSTIQFNHLPDADHSVDRILLLSAVHEMRTGEERISFLKECRRVCKPDGQVILMEHLRDLPNFLAFTIGFTHFFSRGTWKKAFEAAGFSNCQEIKFTPFMSAFICSP